MHLEFNDFDLAGIHNTVTAIKKAGLESNFDISQAKTGVVTVTADDWHRRDGSVVRIEIHKVAKKALFGKKATWIAQLSLCPPGGQTFEKKGCALGSTLVGLMADVELDIKHNYLSVLSLEFAMSMVDS